jgi:hypothetical protein
MCCSTSYLILSQGPTRFMYLVIKKSKIARLYSKILFTTSILRGISENRAGKNTTGASGRFFLRPYIFKRTILFRSRHMDRWPPQFHPVLPPAVGSWPGSPPAWGVWEDCGSDLQGGGESLWQKASGGQPRASQQEAEVRGSAAEVD